MREVTTAKSAGFCFGVKRAVDMVYDEAKKGERVYTLGPIIHNQQVVEDLEKKGVKVIDSVNDINNGYDATVIIRSHGVPEKVIKALREKNVNIVDATCPFVLKIHKIVKEASQNGKTIIIIGSDNHPEVEGIKGWCVNEPVVLESVEEAENYTVDGAKKLCVVSQTTFNYNKFKELVEILEKKSYDVSVLNTICNATKERQTEAQSIAETVDAMIVIGDKHSSNTQKLYEICSRECHNTYYIQTLDDFDMNQLRSVETVGITAGASTPNNIIEEVQNYVRIIF